MASVAVGSQKLNSAKRNRIKQDPYSPPVAFRKLGTGASQSAAVNSSTSPIDYGKMFRDLHDFPPLNLASLRRTGFWRHREQGMETFLG